MGMMTRMLRLWKADLHGVMDQLEDKGLLLKQYLREMENSLQQKQARCEHLTQTCRQIERDLGLREEEMDKLAKDLDLAVVKTKDDIARMLIRKRRSLQTTCSHLKQQQDLLNEERQKLEGVLGQQRLQYDQFKIKAEAYFRQAKDRQMDEGFAGLDAMGDFQSPTEEEIELELLQRKEALTPGGAA
ncbi:MAG: PspA/IM30 family protein [Proteobacteria bacterium]|nr:PspA/IM30 family protein [Pseudomonadota bacterium]MBU4469686.1 PspA/IM30 family protein [Pseudomonadota bacterium]MCG2751769.1 PspA/IM30 family protein [Desulfobacteraceae bacterium]